MQISPLAGQASTGPQRERLHALLMARGLLAGEALARLQDLGDAGELNLVRTLVGHGLCPAPTLAAALADHWELPKVDLSRSEVDLLPLVVLNRNEAVAHLVLPFSASGLKLHCAVASPEDAVAFAPELAKRSGLTVQLYVAGLSDLLRTIGGCYDAAQGGKRAWQGPDFPKKASRTSLQACAITPYRGGPGSRAEEVPSDASDPLGRPSAASDLPTPAYGTQRTPPSMAAVRRPPPEDLVLVRSPPPALRHEALANDIASALAELAPDSPQPLFAPPPPPPAPEPAAPAPEEEVRTGLRAFAHKLKTVANTDVSLAFKRTSSGQHKPVPASGRGLPSSVEKKPLPPSGKQS